MRKILFSLFFVCIAARGMAQTAAPRNDYSLQVGADLGYATGRFNFAHRLGYGISIQGEYLFADNSALTIGTGYMYFANKYVSPTDSIDPSIGYERIQRFGMVPLLFGMKIDNEGKFYVHPQFGFAFRSDPFISATYALGVGMMASAKTDFSFRFQAVQKKGIVATYFAAKVAYVF
jgi:hypothetical protein